MSIVAETPLASLTVGEYSSIILGDSTPNRVWDIPPGSIFPPGLRLDPETGEISGIATIPGTYSFYIRETNPVTGASEQKEFLVEILNNRGINEVTVQQIVAEFFQLGKAVPSQNVWFEEGIDSDGRKVLSIKANDGGQERVIAFVSIG